MDTGQISSLIDVAMAREKADLVVKNGTLVNVYTGELLDGTGIAVKGEHIAYVGKDVDPMIGADTVVVDARGRFLVPGFIEGHIHLSGLCMISEFVRYAAPGGTTTLVTETGAVANAMGYAGVLALLEVLKKQPILVFALGPPMVPDTPLVESSSGMSNDEIEKVLEEPWVVGLGETFWTRVVDGDPDVLRIMAAARRHRKPVQGHSAGAKHNKLVAYAAAGVLSCHEPITVDEAVERLRLGMHVMVRDGSGRKDLEVVSRIKDRNIDLRRMALCNDGLWPSDLVERGCVDHLVRRAVDLGFDPIQAIQMVTINVAEHFGLDHLIGGIAPGRYANLSIVPDLRTVRCDCVISLGKIVAEGGRMIVPVPEDSYSETFRNTIRLPGKMVAQDFAIMVGDGRSEVEARVMHSVGEMLVAEHRAILAVRDGALQADPAADIIKAAAINRYDGQGARFVGLLKGFGLKSGAMATSFTWDSYNIVVVGASEEDMTVAANRVAELQGGVVLCEKGRVLVEISMPIGGIISTLSAPEIGRRIRCLEQEVERLGCRLSNPFLSLQTLAFTPLIYLRLTPNGLLDVKQQKLVDVLV